MIRNNIIQELIDQYAPDGILDSDILLEIIEAAGLRTDPEELLQIHYTLKDDLMDAIQETLNERKKTFNEKYEAFKQACLTDHEKRYAVLEDLNDYFQNSVAGLAPEFTGPVLDLFENFPNTSDTAPQLEDVDPEMHDQIKSRFLQTAAGILCVDGGFVSVAEKFRMGSHYICSGNIPSEELAIGFEALYKVAETFLP